MSIVFLNGEFILEEKAFVPVSDRGFLFGDGVFATVRVFDGVVENAAFHLNRLAADAQGLRIAPPIIKEEWLRELIVRNKAFNGTWRLKILITGGVSPHLSLPPRSLGILLMTLYPYQETPYKAQKLGIFPEPILRPNAKIKSLSYLDRLMVRDYARQKDYDDAVVANSNQELLETSFSNIFWCVKNEVFTPDPDLPLLSGVTIHVVEEAVRSLGMEMHYVRQTLEDVHELAHFFVCNSLQEIRPAYAVGNRFFEPNPKLEKRLKKAYSERVKEYSLDCRENADKSVKPEEES